MVSLLVAYANNRVIGKDNDLPWHLPADLRRFKELTTEQTVIMGRKTFDSIIARNGKPLPNRTNVVVTRDTGFNYPGVAAAHSLPEALAVVAPNEEAFIIGGAQIFEQALPLADRIYATEVGAEINGDVFFPPLGDGWTAISREHYSPGEKNIYHYSYVTYQRTND